MGVGILSMPFAIRNGGLVFGVIGTFLLGMLYSHCVHLLVSKAYISAGADQIFDNICLFFDYRLTPLTKYVKENVYLC